MSLFLTPWPIITCQGHPLSMSPLPRKPSLRKISKYTGVRQRYDFVAIAVDSMGLINEDWSIYLRKIGKRLTTISGYPHETSFLLQRISVTLQRYNAVAFRAGAVFRRVPDSQTEVSIQFNSIQFNSIQFNSIQFSSIQFSSVQFNSIQFNSIQFNSIQFNSIQTFARANL